MLPSWARVACLRLPVLSALKHPDQPSHARRLWQRLWAPPSRTIPPFRTTCHAPPPSSPAQPARALHVRQGGSLRSSACRLAKESCCHVAVLWLFSSPRAIQATEPLLAALPLRVPPCLQRAPAQHARRAHQAPTPQATSARPASPARPAASPQRERRPAGAAQLGSSATS